MSTYESHPSPIDAQRILNDDRDGYTIQVTLTNLAVRDLVKALARRVFTAACNGKPLQIGARLLYLGGARTDREEATSRLTHALGDHWTPTWNLSADDTTRLAHWLLEQADEPPTCRDCDRLLDTVNDPDATTCGQCTWARTRPIGA